MYIKEEFYTQESALFTVINYLQEECGIYKKNQIIEALEELDDYQLDYILNENIIIDYLVENNFIKYQSDIQSITESLTYNDIDYILYESISGVMAGVGAVGSYLGGKAKDYLSSDLSKTQKRFKRAKGLLGDKLQSGKNAVRSYTGLTSNTIRGIGSETKRRLGEIGSSISTAATNKLTSAAERANQIRGAVSGALSSAKTFVGNKIGAARTAVGNKYRNVANSELARGVVNAYRQGKETRERADKFAKTLNQSDVRYKGLIGRTMPGGSNNTRVISTPEKASGEVQGVYGAKKSRVTGPSDFSRSPRTGRKLNVTASRNMRAGDLRASVKSGRNWGYSANK